MRIEVATPSSASAKDKGDLLEELAARVLRQLQFDVTTQVRKTASELDLLCRHNVSGRTMYAECKAHRDNLSAGVLKNLLGTLHLHDYDEAWLITTGPLGKDAKGFVDEWNKKPASEQQRLSVYSPDRLIELLCTSTFIIRPPDTDAERLVSGSGALGDWTLLITEYGIYWGMIVIESGVPAGAIFFDARNGQLITDQPLLRRIGETDSTLAKLDFDVFARFSCGSSEDRLLGRTPNVVQVQSGDDWADYRPARPEHFVGRKESLDRLLSLLNLVRVKESRTRVFAITGDSGMGKSSLIAKLRDRCANVRHRGKVFLYAVDVRAAIDPMYVHASLIAALNAAAQCGFGGTSSMTFKVSDYSDPLASESISSYLNHLEDSEQVLCLVFDQFEELYSKPELFTVFEEAQKLFLSAIAASSSLVLGFAWKTDSTVQQGHPAYFMWHRLADHRFEVGLSPFTHSEASTALTIFERAIQTRIRPELRRQLIESSQGFPWLVKKLCLHLWEQIRQGASQEELADTLDVGSLFDRDLQSLTKAEATCLRAVAKSAPADWYEILDTYGEDVLRSLQQRRLVVRSGDRLNVYWDIFRDYVLTSAVPSLPYTYLPSSPSIRSFLSVASLLDHTSPKSLTEITRDSGLKESTAQNIIHDLLMFGVATGSPQHILLDERVESATLEDILLRMRQVLRRHALSRCLSRYDRGELVSYDDLIGALKSINRAAQHRARTWRHYADRMCRWLVATGLAIGDRGGWRLQDRGEVVIPKNRRQRVGAFLGDAPPARALEAIAFLRQLGTSEPSAIKAAGYRNAVAVLQRFGIAQRNDDKTAISLTESPDGGTDVERLWQAAQREDTIRLVAEYLQTHPNADGEAIASRIAVVGNKWTKATRMRVGNGLRQWAEWTLNSTSVTPVPPVPRRKRRRRGKNKPNQGRLLFDEETTGQE